jgi:hypothetical protein
LLAVVVALVPTLVRLQLAVGPLVVGRELSTLVVVVGVAVTLRLVVMVALGLWC